MSVPLWKQPAALIPVAMSLCGLALVLGHAAVYGVVHEADEGAAAHIFQLLIVLQLPMIAWFALRWLPRATSQALKVLGVQVVAMGAAFASVYFLT